MDENPSAGEAEAGEVRGIVPYAQVPEALAYDHRISDKAVRVFVVIMRHVNQNLQIAWPGRERIAEILDCSPDTVDRAITCLKQHGWISVTRRGLGLTNQYHVNFAGSESADLRTLESLPARTKRELGERELVLRARPADSRSEVVPDTFTAFWEVYPRKVAKPKALTAYQKALTRATAEQIMEGLSAWAGYWQARNEPEYVPHPTTWLNQDRWNDEPPPVTPSRLGTLDLLSNLDEDWQSR